MRRSAAAIYAGGKAPLQFTRISNRKQQIIFFAKLCAFVCHKCQHANAEQCIKKSSSFARLFSERKAGRKASEVEGAKPSSPSAEGEMPFALCITNNFLSLTNKKITYITAAEQMRSSAAFIVEKPKDVSKSTKTPIVPQREPAARISKKEYFFINGLPTFFPSVYKLCKFSAYPSAYHIHGTASKTPYKYSGSTLRQAK